MWVGGFGAPESAPPPRIQKFVATPLDKGTHYAMRVLQSHGCGTNMYMRAILELTERILLQYFVMLDPLTMPLPRREFSIFACLQVQLFVSTSIHFGFLPAHRPKGVFLVVRCIIRHRIPYYRNRVLMHPDGTRRDA